MSTAETASEGESQRQVNCERVRDLYHPAARRQAADLIRRHLDTHILTVVELLHDSGHQRKFLDAGTTMTDAVQRAARAQVKGTNTPVTQRVKTLEGLVDSCYKDMHALDAEKSPVAMADKGLAGVVKAAGKPQDPADAHMVVFRSLTRYLRDGTSWYEKVTWVLDLLPEQARQLAEEAEAPQPPAGLSYIDGVLSELLITRQALLSVFGKQERLSALVQLLIALYSGDKGEVRLGKESDETRAWEIVALLARFKMPQTRQVLVEHIERTVAEPTALTGRRDLREIEALCHLAQRLKGQGELMTEATKAALEKRAYSMCHADTVSQMLGEEGDPGQGLAVLFQAYPYLPGDSATKQLRDFFRRLGEDPQWVQKMAPSSLGVVKRLRRIGELHRRMRQAKLGTKLEKDLSEDMRRLEYQLVRENDLFKRIDQSKGSAADKAVALIDLCYAGAFLDADLRERARQLVSKYVNSEGFVQAYLKGVADTQERNRKLAQLARRLDAISVQHNLRSAQKQG